MHGHEKMVSVKGARTTHRRVYYGIIVPAFMLDRGCLADHQERWHGGVFSIRAASANGSPSVEGGKERIGVHCVRIHQLQHCVFNYRSGVSIPLLKTK